MLCCGPEARPIGFCCCQIDELAQRSHQVSLSALSLLDSMQCKICRQRCSWCCASEPVVLQENAKPARPGETIYKGHHSYDLMRNLQLGIIFSIAKSVEQASGGGLRSPATDEDFAQQVILLSVSSVPACNTRALCLGRPHQID